ncbi:hypothetical protein K439DRAFT_775428 [Ramaria rubella]|nr:hypothetical protein K439DRAFT_775428 [Ramaria rubella]
MHCMMGYKYAMEGLQNGIVRRLQEDWPLNRSDYVVRQQLLGTPRFRVHESIKLIKTAQKCGISSLLPSAFFELAATRPIDWTEAERKACQELSSEDLLRLYIGRERSRERLMSLVTWTTNDSPWMWRSRLPRHTSHDFQTP